MALSQPILVRSGAEIRRWFAYILGALTKRK